MKKIITSLAVLALLVSCSETQTEIEQGKKETADLVSQITDKVVEKGEERKEKEKSNTKLSSTNLDQECQIEKIFQDGDDMFVSLRTFTTEEIPNTQEPDLPIARILIGEEVLTFKLSNEKYFDCGHEKELTIEELKAKWSENTDVPMRVKSENGNVIEFYKDDCSG